MAVHCNQLSFQPRHRCDECSEHCYTECSVQFFTKNCRVVFRAESFRNPRLQIHCLLPYLFAAGGGRDFLVTRRVLGAFFHRKLQSFRPSGEFSQPAASNPLSLPYLFAAGGGSNHSCAVTGAQCNFSFKNSEFLTERKSFRSPRLQIHCLLQHIHATSGGCNFPQQATTARYSFSERTAGF